MKNDGFTLVEMIIVMALIAILAAMATLNWNSLTRKSAMESQIKTIHADLLSLRSEALYRKSSRRVVFGSKTMTIYSTATVTTTPQQVKTFTNPMLWNSSGNNIVFDTSGLASGTEKSICIVPVSTTEVNDAAVDSLVISAARINLGKRTGGDCDTGNITQK